MNIYYDPTDGVLMTPDGNGGYTVVQTNAQLDPSRISLSKEGYLTLLDFEGISHTMCDENNVPISLMGPQGPKGDRGPQGVAGAIISSEYLNDVLSHTCGIPQLTKTYGPGNMAASVKICHLLPAGTYKALASSINIDKYDTENEGFHNVCIVVGNKFDINNAYDLNTAFTVVSPSPIYLWYADKDFIASAPDGQVMSQFTVTISNLRIVDLATESGINSVTCENGILEIQYTDKQGQTRLIEQPVIGPKGNNGTDGRTWVPNVSKDGELSWTIGDVSSIQSVNIKGDTGETGPIGAQFVMTNEIDQAFESDPQYIIENYPINIGDYTISTDSNTIWVLQSDNTFKSSVVVKGDKGDKGERGDKGEQGEVISIASIDASNGINTVTFSDGNTLTVNDGVKGEAGEDGTPGTKFIVPTDKFTDGYLSMNAVRPQDVQPGDYTISVDSQTMWVWDVDTDKFKPLFALKGNPGENPFTEEEVITLKDLPNVVTSLQSRIEALEQALQNIDLSGLAVAYPVSKEE